MTASRVLKPGQQIVRVLSEQDFLGTAVSGKDGWLEVVYQGENIPNVYLIGDNAVSKSLAGSPFLRTNSRQVLPVIDRGRAQLCMVNPTRQHVEVQLTLRGGPAAPSKALGLDAGEMIVSDVAALFPEVQDWMSIPIPFIGEIQPIFLLVESDRDIVCTSMITRGDDSAAIPALSTASAVVSGAIPYYVSGLGYCSRATFVNDTDHVLSVNRTFLTLPVRGK